MIKRQTAKILFGTDQPSPLLFRIAVSAASNHPMDELAHKNYKLFCKQQLKISKTARRIKAATLPVISASDDEVQNELLGRSVIFHPA